MSCVRDAMFEVSEGVGEQGGCPWLNQLLIGIKKSSPGEMVSEPKRSKPNQREMGRAACRGGVTGQTHGGMKPFDLSEELGAGYL